MPGKLVSKPFSVEVKVPERTKLISEIKRLRSSLPTEREFAFIEETSEEDAARVREVSDVVLHRVSKLEHQLAVKLKATRERSATALTFRNERLKEQQQNATVKWLQHEAQAMDYLSEKRHAAAVGIQRKKEVRDSHISEINQTREQLVQMRLSPLKSHIADWGTRMSHHENAKEASFLQRSHEIARASNDRRSTLETSANQRMRDSQFESSMKEDALHQKLFETLKNRELVIRDRTDRNSKFAQRYPSHVQEVLKEQHDHFYLKAAQSEASVEASRLRRQQNLKELVLTAKCSNDARIRSASERARHHFETLQGEREMKWSSIRHRFDEIRSREQDQREQIVQMRLLHSNELSFRGTKNAGSISPASTMRAQTPGSFSYFSNNDDETSKTSAVADRLISRILKAANSGKHLQSSELNSPCRSSSSNASPACGNPRENDDATDATPVQDH
jgi:hypothetical protein